MNNIIADLTQFAHNQKICAVYFKSPNGLSNLKFHFLVFYKNQWVITQRTLCDDKFFAQLYKQTNISKNQLLDWIDSNIKKQTYLHLDSKVDIVITLPIN